MKNVWRHSHHHPNVSRLSKSVNMSAHIYFSSLFYLSISSILVKLWDHFSMVLNSWKPFCSHFRQFSIKGFFSVPYRNFCNSQRAHWKWLFFLSLFWIPQIFLFVSWVFVLGLMWPCWWLKTCVAYDTCLSIQTHIYSANNLLVLAKKKFECGHSI